MATQPATGQTARQSKRRRHEPDSRPAHRRAHCLAVRPRPPARRSLPQPGCLAGPAALSRRASHRHRRHEVHGRAHQHSRRHPHAGWHRHALPQPRRHVRPRLAAPRRSRRPPRRAHGRRILFLITYHWSRGNPKRGCAGFGYDTAAAIAHTEQIRGQMAHIFGSGHGTVYPLVCGFETDEEALAIHGSDGSVLDLASLGADDLATLEPRLAALLPDMPAQMRADLLPLLRGNLNHIADIRTQIAQRERQLDIEHREWVICIGRGFDFLHTPNLALIIGPYSPDLADPVRKAAGIIRGNMQAGRIPDDGCLLLASVPYDEIGVDRARAEMKSRFLSQFAAEVIA